MNLFYKTQNIIITILLKVLRSYNKNAKPLKWLLFFL